MDKSKVSVIRVEDNRIYEAVEEAIQQIGGISRFMSRGMSVVLKPNYTGNLPEDSGGVTSNRVIESVIRLLRTHGAGRIAILEGCGTIALGTKKIFHNLGIDQIAKTYQVELIDANLAEMCTVENERFLELEQVTFCRAILEFDLVINIPVMKTHPLVDVTVAMKNMNGLLSPTEKRHFHNMNLRQAIVDFHHVLPNYLTIVDGLIGMEGMGPAEGMPVNMNLILAGENPASIDATAARIMGFDPMKIMYLQYAKEAGIGAIADTEIQIMGCAIEDVMRRFAPAVPEDILFEGIEIIEMPSSIHCVGCRAVVSIALNRIKAMGQLEEFVGMKILLHNAPEKEIVLKKGEHLFCIGNCTRQYYKDLKGEQMHHILGCAPAGLTVEEAFRLIYKVERVNVETTATPILLKET